MRRETVILLAVLIICIGAAAAQLAPESPSDEACPVYLELDFRADDPQYFAGGPVPFALRLRLAPGVPQVTVPDDWYTGTRFAWVDAGAGGSRARINTIVPRPTGATAARPAGGTVQLVPEKSGDSVYLVIRPDDTKIMDGGNYELWASLNVPGVSCPAIRREAGFTIVSASSAEERSRLALMTATYQVENENDLDGAIETVGEALRETGNAELNYRLGWLYESRGDLREAIDAYRAYVTWARASGIPRNESRRGPQEIADELEEVITVLQGRLDASQ